VHLAHRHHLAVTAVLLGSLVLAAAGCSDDDEPGAGSGADRTTTTSATIERPSAPKDIPASDAVDEFAANLPGNAEGAGVVAACTTVSGLASKVAAGLATEESVAAQVDTLAERVRPIDAKVADALGEATVGEARDWCVAHAFAN